MNPAIKTFRIWPYTKIYEISPKIIVSLGFKLTVFTYTRLVYVHFFAENYVYVHFSIREFENPSINEPMCMCTFQKAIYTLSSGFWPFRTPSSPASHGPLCASFDLLSVSFRILRPCTAGNPNGYPDQGI